MSPALAWALAGLVLCGAEMVVPGVFLLWIGLAALGTGAVALLGVALGWQVAAFVVLAVALVGAAWAMLRRRPRVDAVNAPDAGLVGQVCRAVLFEDGEGRVALGDGQWLARLVSGATAAPGMALRVVGLDGTVLLVAPAVMRATESNDDQVLL